TIPARYEKALNAYRASMDTTLPLATRYNLLIKARDIFKELDDQHIGTTLALIRTHIDLGDSQNALKVVRELNQAMNNQLQIKLDRPFVPPIAAFDTREIKAGMPEWLQCSIFEAFEKLRADSSFHNPQGHIPALNKIKQNPNHSLEMDRRLALCALRSGKQIRINKESALCKESEEHRNVWFWQGLAPKQEKPAVSVSVNEQASSKQQKPTIRILHQMARGGGTIISRCLGCMQDVILLSEVHPLAMQVAKQYGNTFSPLHQAHRWFGLFSAQEVAELEKEDLGYSRIIQEIQERVAKQGKVLVLRDWSHLDFTGVPFVQSPSYAFSHAKTLAKDFQVIHTATVRHPIDQWLSVSKLGIIQGKLDLDQFLYGYLEFARQARDIGFIRYEDFAARPDQNMAILCQKLGVPFDPDFEQNWSEYDKITGDTSQGKLKTKEIKEPVRKEVPEDLLQDFSRNEHYQESLEILGYEHPQGVIKSDKRLPRIVTTSVIRSAYQGQSHGGVYIVDLQEETSEQVVDWDTVDIDWSGRGLDRGLRGIAFYKQEIFIAASDELFVMGEGWQIARSYRNPYLKHCHEICLHQDRIYLTSTGFDSVLEFDPDQEMFTKGYHLRQKPDEQELTQWTFDPNQDDGPQAGDSIHINNVCSHDGQLFMSALRLPYLFKLEGSSFVKQLDIPTGTHNARPYKDGVLFNNTTKSTVCYMDSSGNIVQEWNIPIYSESKLENPDLPKDHARQGFGRGLCPLDEDIVIAGSSPATISVYSSKDNSLIKTINLSRDIRNAIHGLEILSSIPASQLQEEPHKLYISAELPKREAEEPNAYVRNFNELASCRDESYSEIYIDHILLQLSQHELPAVLKGLHRILTPQGKLKISIPDLDVLCRHFLDPDLTANQRLQVMNMMYCCQDQTGALQRMGLNFDLLRSYLLQAEFEEVEKSAYGLMPKDASTFSLDGESIYLNVTAYKQAPSKADSTSEGNISVDKQSD
ncbi:MAG: hypothetical protein ACOC0S_06300, partial [Desulfohalobiaceae bacterium]